MRCACGEMCGLTERAVQRHAVAYMCSLLIDGIAIHVATPVSHCTVNI